MQKARAAQRQVFGAAFKPREAEKRFTERQSHPTPDPGRDVERPADVVTHGTDRQKRKNQRTRAQTQGLTGHPVTALRSERFGESRTTPQIRIGRPSELRQAWPSARASRDDRSTPRASPPTWDTFTRPAARPQPPRWWSPPSSAPPAHPALARGVSANGRGRASGSAGRCRSSFCCCQSTRSVNGVTRLVDERRQVAVGDVVGSGLGKRAQLADALWVGNPDRRRDRRGREPSRPVRRSTASGPPSTARGALTVAGRLALKSLRLELGVEAERRGESRLRVRPGPRCQRSSETRTNLNRSSTATSWGRGLGIDRHKPVRTSVRRAVVKAVSPAKRGPSVARRLDDGEHTRTLMV